MKIAHIRCYRQEQPFRDGPYVISGGRAEIGFDSLIVRLETGDGHIGWGEMAPLGATYDPSFAEGARAGAELLADALIGEEVRAPAALARLMDGRLKGHPYAKSAFDMAAWDLFARAARLPLCALLGGRYGDGTALYRSLSRATPEAMATRAAKYWEEGYRRLQVKVGGDPLEDAASLRAVVAALPREAVLFCDANGGFSCGDARRFLALTADLRYTLEQPCASWRECVALRAQCSRPLVLDESIERLEHVARAAFDGIDGITIKIARVGGITPARLMRDCAVELGLAVTVEDTGGAEIDTAAIAHLSISTPAARRAHTVDFHNWVTVSQGTGLPETRDGLLRPPDGPGLGIAVDEESLGEPFLTAG